MTFSNKLANGKSLYFEKNIPQVKKIKLKMLQAKILWKTIKMSKNWIWHFSKKNHTQVEKNKESFDFSGSRYEERVNEIDSILKLHWELKVWRTIWNDSNLWNTYESDCSEIEVNKAEFVTIIMVLFDIYNEDGDGTCLFRAISRLIYELQIIVKKSEKVLVTISLQDMIDFLISF